MSVSAELKAQRRQTDAFIKANPTSVILSRAESVPNGAGGFRQGAPSALTPQEFRFIEPGASYGQGEAQLLDGEMVRVDWILLGRYDADLKRGDWFYKDGIKYEVVTVRSTGNYEVKAEVTNRG